MTISISSLCYVVLLVWATRRVMYIIGAKKKYPYPPGPAPKPFIGNMLDFPTTYAGLAYTEWGKKYNSHILHAEALGNHIIIINKVEDANELLERPERAKIYSDRPTIPIIDIMGWNINIAIMRYGDLWRQHRKLCHQKFNSKAVRNYEPLQTRKVRELLQGLLDTPDNFEAHSKMFSVSLTISMMYGYEVKSIEEPCVTMADEAVFLGTRILVPGASVINVIPSLRHIPEWFPFFSSRKMAAKIRRMTDEVIKFPLDYVKKSFEEGTAVPSLVTDFYEKKYTVGVSQEEEDIVKNVAYTVYGAASDTTISFTGSFLYLMVVNPDAQRKAQAEIDRVIGSKRLPTHADRPSLPYIEAMYREVLRMRPPFPLGVPHCLTEDDYYKGYFIPKGATIFTNIWAMSHDEEVYPDPYAFKPERYFEKTGDLKEEKLLGYGFGRRVCVGKHVASTTVWLMVATVLACFNIIKRKDEDGNDIEVNGDFEDNGLMNHKSKFECSFQARSSAAQKMIADMI